ncbi:MAG: KH domain-containing protein [Armatimonadota bacterium]|nr:KH domain-containing protein [Armatimonadota bacterium]MCX7777329.1 KH domain-containing protein [Armatimonadota bacterium]MDW8024353.1 KH domain-containing protein [Armatimonadota bacterium]
MMELVEYIVRQLVDQPDKVQVRQLEGERTVVIEIKVADEDLGKVIGRKGRIAQAIRTLVRAAATKRGKKVTVEILPPSRSGGHTS